MSRKNEMYRALLGRPTATLAANIFDPLSARIAQIAGYELLVLSGSVGKASNLAAPDRSCDAYWRRSALFKRSAKMCQAR